MRAAKFTLFALALFAWAGSALAQIDVELAFDPTEVYPGDTVTLFASIAWMGDEPVVAELSMTALFDEYEIGPFSAPLPLAAGEELSHEFSFWVPPIPIQGDLTLILEAVAGDYSDSATAVLTILSDGDGYASGDEFADLPGLILDEITGEGELAPSLSAVKALY